MCGTVFNMTLSHDAKQKYLLVADGTNDMVWILIAATENKWVRSGGNGRYAAGQLHWIDAIAMDSREMSTERHSER